MALNEIFSRFLKVYNTTKNSVFRANLTRWNYFIYFSLIIFLLAIFATTLNLTIKKNKIEQQRFNSVIKSNEFSNLSNYFISKINSPYKEIKYLIQNNDNIEKILKKI